MSLLQQLRIDDLVLSNDALVESGREKDKRIKELEALIELVVSDLRMRADEDKAVNISNFIWEKLEANQNETI